MIFLIKQYEIIYPPNKKRQDGTNAESGAETSNLLNGFAGMPLLFYKDSANRE